MSNMKSLVPAIKKLIIVSIISVILLTAEITGGIFTKSLSILSHSAFMLSEFLVYEISIISLLLSNNKPSKKLSFGYHRSEIIFSVTSVLLIWTMTGILIVESLHAIEDNKSIELMPEYMFYVALFGFISNCIMVHILHIFGNNHKHKFEVEITEENSKEKREKGKIIVIFRSKK